MTAKKHSLLNKGVILKVSERRYVSYRSRFDFIRLIYCDLKNCNNCAKQTAQLVLILKL